MGKTLLVWKLFTESEGNCVHCSLCNKKVSYHDSITTMKSHLNHFHLQVHNANSTNNQRTRFY